MLSHGFWMRRFGGDRGVVGRWIEFDGNQFQIVGVAPAGFTGVEPGIRTDLWMPLTTYSGAPEALTEGGSQWFRIMGRLAPGVSAEEAQAALQPAYTHFLRDRVKEAPPDAPKDLLARFVRTPLFVRPGPNGLSDLRLDFERPLWILAAVVGLVLLIACSNVANLLTARAAAREREMALRMSIGAGRARLIQQLLIESFLISTIACALGVLFAAVAAPTIVTMLAPSDAPVYLEFRASWRVLAFVGVIALMTSVLFGLAPALRASSTSPIDALKGMGGRVIGRIGHLRPLVAAQVAFSLAVVFLASLLVASFVRLTTVDMGFTKSGITLFKIWSDELRQRETPEPRRRQPLEAQVIDRMRHLPSVNAASISFWALFEGSAWSSLVSCRDASQTASRCTHLEVSPGFMQTMGIRLLDGRDFYGATSTNTRRVAERSDAGDRERRFRAPVLSWRRRDRPAFRTHRRSRSGRAQDIVGVVANAKYRDVRENGLPTVYLAVRGLTGKTLEVRSSRDPDTLARQVRRSCRDRSSTEGYQRDAAVDARSTTRCSRSACSHSSPVSLAW